MVCRACREAMPDIGWNNPCPHWKETPEHVARLDAQFRDSEARNQTSLEVIRAREEHVEQQRVEIERLRAESDDVRREAAELRNEAANAFWAGRGSCHAEIAKQAAEIERLQIVVRTIRRIWFEQLLKSKAPDREWEDAESELRRIRSNEVLRERYNEQTEYLLAGGSCNLTPLCQSDLDTAKAAGGDDETDIHDCDL